SLVERQRVDGRPTTPPLLNWERTRYRVWAERQKRRSNQTSRLTTTEQLGAQPRCGWEAGIRTPITWSRGGPRNAGDFGSRRFCQENRADRWAVSGWRRPFRLQSFKFFSRIG